MRIIRARLKILCLLFVLSVGAIGVCEAVAFDVEVKSPLNDPDDSSIASPIDRMKRRLAEEQITDHVVLKFKFIELPMVQFRELTLGTQSWVSRKFLSHDGVYKSWGLPGYRGFHDIEGDPDVKAWSTPDISVIAGHEAKFALGQRFPITRTNEDGEITTTYAEDGRSVIAKASILNFNRVRVDVEGQFQTLKKGHDPQQDCRRIQASFELDQGETQAYGRTVVSSSGKETFILVLATASIRQLEIADDLASDPISAVDDVSRFGGETATITAIPASESALGERIAIARNCYTTDLLIDNLSMTMPKRPYRTIRMADQVRLSVEIVELNPAGLDAESLLERRSSFGFRPERAPVQYWKSLMTDFIEIESEHPFSPYSKSNQNAAYFSINEYEAWPTYRHQDLGAMWRSHPSSRVWKFPEIHATSDESLECHVGGEATTLKLRPNGCEEWRTERFGASIDAAASVEDSEYARLSLDICLKDLEETAGGLKVTNARRTQSTIRILSGQAIYLGQSVVSELGQETFLCIRIHAQILPRPSSDELLVVPEIDTDEIVSALQPDNAPRLDAQSSGHAGDGNVFRDAIHLACWAETIPEDSRFEKIDRICKLTRWRSCSLIDDPELLPNAVGFDNNPFVGQRDWRIESVLGRREWTGQSQLRLWQPKPKFRGLSVYYYDDLR